MERFDYQEHGLVEVLITAQEEFGCLSKELLTYVSAKLHLPLSQVYGVATFYDLFTLEPSGATHAMVCTGPPCFIAGSKAVLAEACDFASVSEPDQTSVDGRYTVKEVSCLGLCDQAPAMLVNKQAQVNISIDDIPAILQGQESPPSIQVCGEPRILTDPIGRLPPTDLDAHRSEGAFIALEKALCTMTPEEIIEDVKDSRLSGRGGAGFKTGTKWELAREASGKPKYFVCNFDESEPGTFKDRVLMEGNPLRVIEGMTIGAFATGAHKGYIFVRGEYSAATDILEEVLEKLYTESLLGGNILGSGYTFDIEVRHNAGAYICGEETALFESIEGRRGHPREKPPYPTQAGLFGKPTIINNVETLAVVPSLILNGGEWFCQWGTVESVGLKLFCLSGHIMQPGVVEVPYGLSVRELIESFGGGFIGDPQAILVGGATGGFLHPENLDTPLAHEDLLKLNVPIGSGAIMVFNQSVDLWQVLQTLAHFFVHETCGRCAPCRLGTMQIYKLLNKINLGVAASGDFKQLQDLGEMIKTTCVCGLGMTAANPVMTVLNQFEVGARG
jgi:NADH-quinone oxidoreductase subunit F